MTTSTVEELSFMIGLDTSILSQTRSERMLSKIATAAVVVNLMIGLLMFFS